MISKNIKMLPKVVEQVKHTKRKVLYKTNSKETILVKTEQLLSLEKQISNIWIGYSDNTKDKLLELLAKWGGVIDGASQLNQLMKMLSLTNLQIDLNDLGVLARKVYTMEITNILLEFSSDLTQKQRDSIIDLVLDGLKPKTFGEPHAQGRNTKG